MKSFCVTLWNRNGKVRRCVATFFCALLPVSIYLPPFFVASKRKRGNNGRLVEVGAAIVIRSWASSAIITVQRGNYL